MKLIDLHPRFFGAGGASITNADGSPTTERRGVGLSFDCPCSNCKEEWERCAIHFANPIAGGPPISSGPHWQRTGEDFETMTIHPSIRRSEEHGGCGWHGWITNGEVVGA